MFICFFLSIICHTKKNALATLLHLNYIFQKGKLQNHKWENCLTVDKGSWGYRRNVNINSYLTINQLLYQLASTVR